MGSKPRPGALQSEPKRPQPRRCQGATSEPSRPEFPPGSPRRGGTRVKPSGNSGGTARPGRWLRGGEGEPEPGEPGAASRSCLRDPAPALRSAPLAPKHPACRAGGDGERRYKYKLSEVGRGKVLVLPTSKASVGHQRHGGVRSAVLVQEGGREDGEPGPPRATGGHTWGRGHLPAAPQGSELWSELSRSREHPPCLRLCPCPLPALLLPQFPHLRPGQRGAGWLAPVKCSRRE